MELAGNGEQSTWLTQPADVTPLPKTYSQMSKTAMYLRLR
jgi:hypothetical protein